MKLSYALFTIAGLVALPGCDFFSKKESPAAPQRTEKTIFSFLGAPGSGKGTLAEQCVKQLDFKVLSTGNLCREAIASGSELGKQIESYVKSGGLIPDDMVTGMVDGWLSKQASSNEPIILDGFPRTQKQAALFLDMMKQKYPDYRIRIIALAIPDEEIVARLADRLMCENKKCQAVYNRKLMKDPNAMTCTTCGGKLIRREDDKEEVVRARLAVFAKANGELVQFYKTSGVTVETINASQVTPEQIFENFKKMIG
jgi:adenylate kinase